MDSSNDHCLPDFGRDIGRRAPVSIDHLCIDKDVPKDVKLVAVANMDNDPHTNHWFIVWPVDFKPNVSAGDVKAFRLLQAQQEPGIDHLTNWGLLTKTLSANELNSLSFHVVGQLTLSARKRLEEIAADNKVRIPDRYWNCQNWVKEVFQQAQAEGILDEVMCNGAFGAASAFGSEARA